MSCRRICRELLEVVRFGQLGPGSAAHLDHLADCRECRDEVGFDRALVHRLRTALAERVAGASPSSDAWGAIVARTQAREGGLGGFLRAHAAVLAARLRAATAITAVALAGVIATSTNVAVSHPESGSAETEVRASAAGERFERLPLVERSRSGMVGGPPARVAYVAPAGPKDPEAAFIVDASAAPVISPPVEEPVRESSIETSVEIVPADAATGDAGAQPTEAGGPTGVRQPLSRPY